ncbi:endothelial differentiation-related factor 1-like [Gigantopelta aegis]|uniref:endothelial differentiation-related factor 1-like n=1 Tax=Gigantopelta aegis TaxID=1735272 RepID=UPI001B88AF1C|nr:endothelial differentiation-related factor 1-like [Gigantopelta aegis]
MAEADWEEVTYIGKRQPKGSQLKTEKAISAAKRQGLEIDTGKKFGGGGNKQHSSNKNTAVLDRETEELHHDSISLDVAKLIQLYRQKKNLTQKELATKINEKQQVINEYEAGKALPNNQVMGKLERTLGVKLRGKDKGQPFQQKK